MKRFQTRMREGPLSAQATALLRSNGYTWSGRYERSLEPEQYLFERSIIRNKNGPWPKNSRHA